jgi:hypothetical protein
MQANFECGIRWVSMLAGGIGFGLWQGNVWAGVFAVFTLLLCTHSMVRLADSIVASK